MSIKSIFSITIIFLLINSLHAQSIQWRGEDRKGHYPEKELMKEWPEGGPDLILEINDIGNGYGSPAVTSDRIYIMGEIDSIGILFVFDKSGKIIWKNSYGKEWTKSFRGSRSTPTIVNDLIYTCSGLGEISCFQLEDGKKLWSKDLKTDFNGQYTYHGHSESPLVSDDKVYLVAGNADTNVVALDRFTGDTKWICKGKSERPAYNSPNLISLKKRNIIVVFSAYHLMGIDAGTGELLWTHEQTNMPVEERKPGYGDTHSNTVYYKDGYIYYFAGDGNCAVKLALSEDGKSIKEVWRNSLFDNYMGGIVKIENYLYGGSTHKKDLKVLDSETGAYTDSLKIGSGSIITDENLLYYYSYRGFVNLLKPNSGKAELISSFKISKGTKEHFSHPVISYGSLYLRHGNVLLIYDIRNTGR